jgi:hypothetical protein
MMRRMYHLIFIVLLIALLSGCSSPTTVNLRYDVYDPLAQWPSTDVNFQLDHELVISASEQNGWFQLSATQAFYLSQIDSQLSPRYALTVTPVIMMQKNNLYQNIDSFDALFATPLKVGIVDEDSDFVKWLVYVLSHNGEERLPLSHGLKLLGDLYIDKQLIILNHQQAQDPLLAWQQQYVDVIICWDYQANTINHLTDNAFQVIVPIDTISTNQYLTVKEPFAELTLPEKDFIQKNGYVVVNEFDFQEAAIYMSEYTSYKQDFQRLVRHEFKNSFASVSEKVFVNLAVLLIFVGIAMWIYVRAKFKNRLIKLLAAIVCCLLLWQFLWIIRLLVNDQLTWLKLFLWYCAYPLILYSVMIWHIMNRELLSGNPLTYHWKIIYRFIIVLAPVVFFTNTYHQQIFRFDSAMQGIYWYNHYSYQWGFWFYYLIVIGFWVLGMIDYIRYAMVKERRRQLLYLLLMMLSIIGLNLLFLSLRKLEIIFDVAWQTSYFGLFFVNFAYQNKFLDSGFDFSKLLNRMKIPLAIAKNRGQWLYKNKYFEQVKGYEVDNAERLEPLLSTIIEDKGHFYRLYKLKQHNKIILWMKDITYLEKKKRILLTEQAVLSKTQELLKKEVDTLNNVLTSYSQLIINEDAKVSFNHTLSTLLATLKRIKHYGVENNPLLEAKAKAEVGRTNRYLRIMLWSLQDEQISIKQIIELLKSECLQTNEGLIEPIMIIKPKSEFPKKYLVKVFNLWVHLLDDCHLADYQGKLMMRLVTDAERLKLYVMLSSRINVWEELNRYCSQQGMVSAIEIDGDTTSIVVIFGEEVTN